jgi:hypothetical protein
MLLYREFGSILFRKFMFMRYNSYDSFKVKGDSSFFVLLMIKIFQRSSFSQKLFKHHQQPVPMNEVISGNFEIVSLT